MSYGILKEIPVGYVILVGIMTTTFQGRLKIISDGQRTDAFVLATKCTCMILLVYYPYSHNIYRSASYIERIVRGV